MVGFGERVPPIEPEELRAFIQEELREIRTSLGLIDNLQLVELHVEPIRPRTGMVVLADGTNWDPGSGAGFYGYRGAAWALLG